MERVSLFRHYSVLPLFLLVLRETREWVMCAAESKSLCAVLGLFLVASDKCAADFVHVRVTICLL